MPLPHQPDINARTAFSILNKSIPLALYGAGSVGRDVLELLIGLGYNISYILDTKAARLASIDGVPVLHPDDPAIPKIERDRTPVVVSIFNAYVPMPALHRQLVDIGWRHVVTFLDFFQHFATELGDRYWLTDLRFYEHRRQEYEGAYALWADEKSRDLYSQILRFRFTGDYTALPLPDETGQYFPDDLPPWSYPLRLIDCGAFDGDTLRQAVSLGHELEAVAAFEPDPANYGRLTSNSSDVAKEITLWPCGVSSHTGQFRFAAGHGGGSAISQSGGALVQCVALDDALPTFQPNLIKMDIEGAEVAALLGARAIITRNRPGLAICLYHKPQHLWQIPLLIRDWNLNYRLYLRIHRYNGFDLVMYAIPL